MQNHLASEKNSTASPCDLCMHSPIFNPLLLPYVLISGPANVLVLWLMISSPVFWTHKMEVSEFHLVLTELLNGLMQPMLTFISNTVVKSIMTRFMNIILTARIQFQSGVCLERYLAVVHPVLYLRFKPLRYRMSYCCVTWLQTILIGIVRMFLCGDSPLSVGIFTTYFVYVLIINSFCCLSVLRALKQPSPGDGKSERSNLIKRRAFNIVLLFLVTTVVGYVPLITMLLLTGEIEKDMACVWEPLAYCITIWLGVIYPLLYLRRAGRNLVRNYLCVSCFQK